MCCRACWNFPGATGAWVGLNRVAAGKTGTANNSEYAAFGGYTPSLAAYVSVFHPTDPGQNLMVAPVNSCYQQQGGVLACNGEMFGADAPGHTWQLSFEHANRDRPTANFVPVSGDSPLMSMGDGQSAPQQAGGKGKGKKGGNGNGNGNGNGAETVTATATATGPTASSSSVPAVGRTVAPSRADAGRR